MPEPSTTPDWTIERYQAGDETRILDLFTEVFGRHRSLEHWRWQFADNPYGGPFVTVARRTRDGKLVGSYSVMPVRLNLMGREVPACQSVDTAVHPAYRGQRIFEKTAEDCYAWCRSAGLQAVVGFPNAASYPGFVRGLGWKRIAFPRRYTLHLHVSAALKRILRSDVLAEAANLGFRATAGMRLFGRHALLRRLAGKSTLRIDDAVPAGYDDLWHACRSYEVLSIWKDAGYLRWRYDGNPDHDFKYFHVTCGETMAALAVTVDINGAAEICELIVRDRDVVLGRLLVTEIARYCFARGLRSLSFLGHDHGFLEEVLEGFGRRIAHGDVFGGRAFEAGTLAELLPLADNWTLTFGDGDFV